MIDFLDNTYGKKHFRFARFFKLANKKESLSSWLLPILEQSRNLKDEVHHQFHGRKYSDLNH